jgi:hypothetical protein
LLTLFGLSSLTRGELFANASGSKAGPAKAVGEALTPSIPVRRDTGPASPRRLICAPEVVVGEKSR